MLELRLHLLMNHEAFDWTTAMWAAYNSPIEIRGRWNEVGAEGGEVKAGRGGAARTEALLDPRKNRRTSRRAGKQVVADLLEEEGL